VQPVYSHGMDLHLAAHCTPAFFTPEAAAASKSVAPQSLLGVILAAMVRLFAYETAEVVNISSNGTNLCEEFNLIDCIFYSETYKIMAHYFERQVARQCGVHAFNNAAQKKVLTAADVRKISGALCDKSGFFSSTYVFKAAQIKAGYDMRKRTLQTAKKVSNKNKSYFITGVRLQEGYPHAIAIAKGYIIDSMENKPIKLGTKGAHDYWTRVFKPRDYGGVMEISETPFAPLPPAKMIDLT